MVLDAELLETRDGAVGYLTLNRPEAMNAITVSLARALRSALLRLQDEVEVVVLRGAGDHFSVGGDVSDLARLRDADGVVGVGRLLEAFGAVCETIEQLRIPVVAAVRGYALAGGFEIVQCCDVSVVADDARLGDHHLRMGVVPGGGSSQRLPRIVGRARAMGLILTGDHLSGADAVAWGLAYRAVSEAELDAAVAALAGRLATGNPRVVAATKRLVSDGLGMPQKDGLERERTIAASHLATDGGGLFAAREGG